MRITILTYVESLPDGEVDIVVPQVADALGHRGHEVSVLKVHDDVKQLVDDVRAQRPDLVFNLLEMFGDDLFLEVSATGLLALLGLPHTGGGAGEFYLAQDKALTKKLLAYEGILYPKFAVFSRDQSFETGGNLRLPLFVKPLRADASIGIDSGALCRDSTSLMRRVLKIHDECNDAALAEEYIDGREIYVSVIGNDQPLALPPIEIDFSNLPAGAPHVLDRSAKWEPETEAYRGTHAIVAVLTDELRAKLQKVAIEACRALRVRDYGRVDLRLTESGEIYVLEVNPSCYLERTSELAMAAGAAGIEYDDLVERITESAMARYRRAG